MAIIDKAGAASELETVSATEAKNSFGAVLERVMVDGGVGITKHDQVKAVLLSVGEYEALRAARRDPLAELAGEFDSLVERMQEQAAGGAGRALFGASSEALGEAAIGAVPDDD